MITGQKDFETSPPQGLEDFKGLSFWSNFYQLFAETREQLNSENSLILKLGSYIIKVTDTLKPKFSFWENNILSSKKYTMQLFIPVNLFKSEINIRIVKHHAREIVFPILI